MAAERNYCLTCAQGRIAAQSNRYGNCTTATCTVDTVVLGKFQIACVSKMTVEISRVKRSRSIVPPPPDSSFIGTLQVATLVVSVPHYSVTETTRPAGNL